MDYSGSNQPEGGSSGSGSDDFKYQYKDQGGQGNTPPPSPPPPPPPRAKSFNWLACCGISCLVIFILGGGMSYCTYLAVKPFMNMGMEMEGVKNAVVAADVAEIRSAAVPVTPSSLSSNSVGMEDMWLALEGVIVMDGSGTGGQYGSVEGTVYVLENNTIVMDTSNAPRKGIVGDTIQAYGKVFAWDLAELGKIPMIGSYIEAEMAKDPQMAGNTKIVFFIAKEVELVGGSTNANPCTPAEDVDDGEPVDTGQDDGWL